MSIPDSPKKINIVIFVALAVVFGFFLVFGGLKLSFLLSQKQPIRIVTTNMVVEASADGKGGREVIGNTPARQTGLAGEVVASKNSTKFHLLDCPGARQIIDKNKVYFENAAAAIKAGLTPAGNCKGLKKQ